MATLGVLPCPSSTRNLWPLPCLTEFKPAELPETAKEMPEGPKMPERRYVTLCWLPSVMAIPFLAKLHSPAASLAPGAEPVSACAAPGHTAGLTTSLRGIKVVTPKH